MDASCKIQRSIHDVRLTYKYVSRILGTYQFQAAFSIKLPEKQPHSQVVAMLYELDSVSTITVI